MPLGPRSRLEHASAPAVERVQAVPLSVRAVITAVIIVIGVLAPRPWGGLAFLLVAAFVGWLLFLTWRHLSLPERLMRLAVLDLAVALTIVRTVPA